MFAPKCIDEDERLSKLLSFDQEASAINLPCSRRFSHVHSPFGGRDNEKTFLQFKSANLRFLLQRFLLQIDLVAGGENIVGLKWVEVGRIYAGEGWWSITEVWCSRGKVGTSFLAGKDDQ
jgi:hypothetical protein